MPETLSAGPTYLMVQNQIYALPPRPCRVQATAQVEVSQTTATTGFAVLASATTGVECFAQCIRNTTGTTTLITVKTY